MNGIPEEWEDKDVREWLEVIKEKKGINVSKPLEERYEHWDMQLFLAAGDEPVTDLEGNPYERTSVQDELAESVQAIYDECIESLSA